jgi:hypothetical protein
MGDQVRVRRFEVLDQTAPVASNEDREDVSVVPW